MAQSAEERAELRKMREQKDTSVDILNNARDLSDVIKNKHPQFDNGVLVTKDNIVDVAEWCNARITSPWSTPRLHVKTGFGENPDFLVEVNIGDKMEKTEDGKFQVWINPNARSEDELLDRGAGMGDRAEMLMEPGFNPQAKAVALVRTLYYGEHSEFPLDVTDVYIVWFCKTLQNWKALVSTNAKDNRYYEITHNGDKNETYIDEYGKKSNVVVHGDTGVYDVNLIVEKHQR